MGFVRRASVGLILWIVALVILIAGIRSIIPQEERLTSTANREREIRVNAIKIKSTTATAHIDSSGSVSSSKIQQIRAPHSGEIVFIADDFKEGANVAKGNRLLSITPFSNNAQGQAQLNVARQDIALAQSTLKNAQSEYQRQKTLFEKGIVNQKSVEQAEDNVNLARQNVITKRAAIVDTHIYANFDGAIRNKNIELNQLVNNNEVIAEIIDNKNLEIEFRLSEKEYRQLSKINSALAISITITDKQKSPSIVESAIIDRLTLSANGERIAYSSLAPDTQFIESDFVYIRLNLPSFTNAIVVPEEALSTDNSVWKINAESRLERRAVNVIARSDSGLIVEGIDDGDIIVSHNQPHLGEGSKVLSDVTQPGDITLNEAQISKISQFLKSEKEIPAPIRETLIEAVNKGTMEQNSFDRIKTRISL